MINILISVIMILFIALLIFGLVQSKKHSFMAGFYSFLILIVNHVHSYIAPLTTHRIMNSYLSSNTDPPLGMSLGELVALLSLIPRVLEVIAFSILILGLYRMWNSKTV
jgi:hypothetical protein